MGNEGVPVNNLSFRTCIAWRNLPYIANFAFIILHFAFLSSCAHRGDSVAANVDVSGWGSDTEYSVVYNNRDSLSLRELSLFVLHERSFATTNDSLLLTITTVTPDSLVWSEELAFYPDRLKTAEAGRFHETARPYRSRVTLGRKGPYTFTFSHRNTIPVEGIKGIGLTIDN